ncbi:hypothetical protein Hanom_Chr02g00118291 [Helianthus anomalus]
MELEKDRSKGNILIWLFVKDLHCMAVKREHEIKNLRSLLSILSLSHYDVSTLVSLEVIHRAEDPRVKLFTKKLIIE